MRMLSLNIRGFGSGKDSKVGDFKKLVSRKQPDVILLQETKCNCVDRNWVSIIWGSDEFDFIQKEKVGKSGGLLLIWDTNVFVAVESIISDFYVAIKERWKGWDVESIIVNVYGPHEDANKLKLWLSLGSFVGKHDVAWFLGGDFNEVREDSERQNCVFMSKRASWFNDFINESRLLDIPLGGKRFTRICDNGLKFTKLDRFLVSEKSIQAWGDLSTLALERKLSDHCPLILRDKDIDFGPKRTKIFDEWLDNEGSEEIIKKAWSMNVGGSRLDCVFRNKMKNVKNALKDWSIKSLGKLEEEINDLKNSACHWELIAEQRDLNDNERDNWMNVRKK
ncbi:uncharacterized protein [Rutidosis leptorrhynchoides]|uniref:uncharacterized protein n=1 Tax=Rutidosis leptorrhynchoides TaxID=125765 RepID=UPI003A9A494D